MVSDAGKPGRLRALEWVLSGLAGLCGLKLGYSFGVELAGLWLGLIMGVNAALFAALLASIVTDRAFRRWGPGTAEPQGPKDG